jgi:hypothetical protein
VVVVKVVTVLIGLVLVVVGVWMAFSLGLTGSDTATTSWIVQLVISVVVIGCGAAALAWATGFNGWRNRRRARPR